jgi:hypothetical protein
LIAVTQARGICPSSHHRQSRSPRQDPQ